MFQRGNQLEWAVIMVINSSVHVLINSCTCHKLNVCQVHVAHEEFCCHSPVSGAFNWSITYTVSSRTFLHKPAMFSFTWLILVLVSNHRIKNSVWTCPIYRSALCWIRSPKLMAFFNVLQFFVYRPFFVLVYYKHTCFTFGNVFFFKAFGSWYIPPLNQEL